MIANDKALAEASVCQCVKPCIVCKCKSVDTSPELTTPRMWPFSRSFMNSFVQDWVAYAQTTDCKVADDLVDCCNKLLIEDERREGGDDC